MASSSFLETISGRKFLVDTGATRSVLPYRSTAVATGPRLIGADGRPITAWGTVSTHLQFGLHKFQFPFLLAAVARPILGIDFLATHKLLVDSSRHCVIDSPTPLQPANSHRPSPPRSNLPLMGFPYTVRLSKRPQYLFYTATASPRRGTCHRDYGSSFVR